MRTVASPTGAAGVITPTGLATDKTTAPFFSDTLSTKRLHAFYDFENEAKIFTMFTRVPVRGHDHDRTGPRRADAVRVLHPPHRGRPARRFELAADEVLTLNPNTGTLPMFRTRADADITLGIYRRHPVLIRETTPTATRGDCPSRGLFDMANDSSLFHQPEDSRPTRVRRLVLQARRQGATFRCTRRRCSATSTTASPPTAAPHKHSSTWARFPGRSEEHDDPDMEPLARHWVDRTEVVPDCGQVGPRVAPRLARHRQCRATIAHSSRRCYQPAQWVTTFLLAFPADPAHGPLLHAVWSSYVFDYVARQKLSGTHMKYFIVKQLACPAPQPSNSPPWQPELTLADWVSLRPRTVLHLVAVEAYAEELGDDGPPFRWDADAGRCCGPTSTPRSCTCTDSRGESRARSGLLPRRPQVRRARPRRVPHQAPRP